MNAIAHKNHLNVFSFSKQLNTQDGQKRWNVGHRYMHIC